MSASIEALAMAGVDYLIHNMDIEEWEQEELEPPPYLLVKEEEKLKEIARTTFLYVEVGSPKPRKKDGAPSDYC
ncbi:hypothetical protein NC652_013248 [Populus alba x Populus x berolinensis]|uniref:Uncharacterized protein n=1 Tax=Populus alba x Populus x berolinensis TaxID=444605 RepID=A0AAD6QU31_9ROSI|nr:hypothetical protein NC652_013248 [Populus alba x Populus x berolinensis]KAJ6996538.1 hypothetical protein NC653_013211 [Populus alba x Populus x berolinensis]